MLKNKISKVTIVMLLLFAIMIPIVRADDNEAENTSETNINATTENTTEATSTDTLEENAENALTEDQETDSSMKKEDVYLTGDNVTIDYVVDGNLFVMANSVTINSQIGGDVFICARTINVGNDAYIYSNLFALANEINISGIVYDLYTSANSVNISGYVYRDIHTYSTNFNLSGTIGRNAYVSANKLEFANVPNEQNTDSSENATNTDNTSNTESTENSTNSENATKTDIMNATIQENSNDDEDETEELKSTKSNTPTIYGNLNYSSSAEASIPDGLVVGDTHYNKPITSNTKTAAAYIVALGKFVVTVILVWLLYLWLAPKFLKESSNILSTKFWKSVGFGILTPIVFSIAFVILVLLHLTTGIALIGLVLFIALLMLSTSTCVIAINNMICKKHNVTKRSVEFGFLVILSVVFWLIELIPAIGSLIRLVLSIIGLGIIIIYVLPDKKNKTKKEKTKTEEK